MSAGWRARGIEGASSCMSSGAHSRDPLAALAVTVPKSQLQLRLVARLDLGLRFRGPEFRLVVNDFADGRKSRAGHLRLLRPKLRAHQGLAAVEIGLARIDAQHRTRQFAELFHRRKQRGIRRYRAGAADAQRLV